MPWPSGSWQPARMPKTRERSISRKLCSVRSGRGVVQGSSKCLCEADALVELADGEQPGVTGQLARGRLDDERRAEKVQDLWPGGW